MDKVSNMLSDREILATLIEKIGVTPKNAEYTDANCLTQLNFSHSGIAALPPEIGKLINLRGLSLSGNRLKQLPSELACLINLEALDLSDNYLTQLPPDLSHMTKMVGLSLANNRLEQLPSDFSKLVSLQALDLSKNQLECLPPDFNQMTGLELLWIDGNLVSQLSEEILYAARVFAWTGQGWDDLTVIENGMRRAILEVVANTSDPIDRHGIEVALKVRGRELGEDLMRMLRFLVDIEFLAHEDLAGQLHGVYRLTEAGREYLDQLGKETETT